jgi:hypothetical protein
LAMTFDPAATRLPKGSTERSTVIVTSTQPTPFWNSSRAFL